MDKNTNEVNNPGEQGRAEFKTGSTTQAGSNYGQGSSHLGGESYQQGDSSNTGSNYDNEADQLGKSTVGTNREGAQSPKTGAQGATGAESESMANKSTTAGNSEVPYHDEKYTADSLAGQSHEYGQQPSLKTIIILTPIKPITIMSTTKTKTTKRASGQDFQRQPQGYLLGRKTFRKSTAKISESRCQQYASRCFYGPC